jgi:hypothetical protein
VSKEKKTEGLINREAVKLFAASIPIPKEFWPGELALDEAGNQVYDGCFTVHRLLLDELEQVLKDRIVTASRHVLGDYRSTPPLRDIEDHDFEIRNLP